MNKFQEQIELFMKAVGQSVGGDIKFRDIKFRKSLMSEEYKEMMSAIDNGDMVEFIDGACDLLYTVLGTVSHFGIDIEPFFNEVHMTNMKKLDGGVNPNGKQLKPKGWKPPRIKDILKRQRYAKAITKSPLNVIAPVVPSKFGLTDGTRMNQPIKNFNDFLSDDAKLVFDHLGKYDFQVSSNQKVFTAAIDSPMSVYKDIRNTQSSKRRGLLCQYFCKQVPLSIKKVGGYAIYYIEDQYIKKVSDIMNHLAKHRMIDYGIAFPVTAFKLYNSEKDAPARALIQIYVFTDYRSDELNQFLGKSLTQDPHNSFCLPDTVGTSIWPDITEIPPMLQINVTEPVIVTTEDLHLGETF